MELMRRRQSRATGADIQHVDRLLIFVLGDRSGALYQRLRRLEKRKSASTGLTRQA
jgi:hypothetical protein